MINSTINAGDYEQIYTTFVESLFPPRPTSIIATSTCEWKLFSMPDILWNNQENKNKVSLRIDRKREH